MGSFEQENNFKLVNEQVFSDPVPREISLGLQVVANFYKGPIPFSWRQWRKRIQAGTDRSVNQSNIKKFGHSLNQPWTDKFYFKWISDRIGWGVFARQDFLRGELIGEYVGHVYPFGQAPNRDYALHAVNWAAGFSYDIDASRAGNHTRFINHSPVANVREKNFYFQGLNRAVYVSTMGIRRGQQLLINYGAEFWTSRSIRPEIFRP